MRVLLPPSSPPPPSPPPASRPLEPSVSAPSSPGKPPVRDRFLASASSWSVALPVLLLCGAALCWSLLVRLPGSNSLLKVHARAAESAQTTRLVTKEELSAMRDQVRERSAVLIRQRKEIPPLLSALEARAQELGWRCEASLKPAIPAPGGVRELTLHPVVIDLRYEYLHPERAYAGLLAWLWTASTLQPRVEVGTLRLQSLGHGVNGAQVELNFFSLNTHEENPSK